MSSFERNFLLREEIIGLALVAVKAAREFGLTVVQVIILVDREEGGRQAVEEQVSRVTAVFTLSHLKGGG